MSAWNWNCNCNSPYRTNGTFLYRDNCLALPIQSVNLIYDGPNLPCSGITTCNTLTVAFQKIDDKLCETGNNVLVYKVISEDFDFTAIPEWYANCIWEIRYTHDLNGEDIIIPENVTLKFVGGKFINYGSVTGDNTKIIVEFNEIFDGSGNLLGTWDIDYVFPQWFGAIGDGITDDTLAMQAAIDMKLNVFIPIGVYLITTSLKINTYAQTISGAGMEGSIIQLQGAINGIENHVDAFYIRVLLRDFRIRGNNTTLDAIKFVVNQAYQCEFKNLYIWTGGRAIYIPSGFSTTFENIHFASYNEHGIETTGGPGTTFINCYAREFLPTKAGFKVLRRASFIGCNGVSLGGIWGIFGNSIAGGDTSDGPYEMLFDSCNFEDCSKYAIELRYNGSAIFRNCTFYPQSTVHECLIRLEKCTQLIQFTGCEWGVGSRTGPSSIIADVPSNFMNIGIGLLDYYCISTNTIYTIPSINSKLDADDEYAISLSKLNVVGNSNLTDLAISGQLTLPQGAIDTPNLINRISIDTEYVTPFFLKRNSILQTNLNIAFILQDIATYVGIDNNLQLRFGSDPDLNTTGNLVYHSASTLISLISALPTPLRLERTGNGSEVNSNMSFTLVGNTSYLGIDVNHKLKFGSDENLFLNGEDVYHSGNLNLITEPFIASELSTIVTKLTPQASAPATPSLGWIYVNTNTHLYFYNGTSWIQLD